MLIFDKKKYSRDLKGVVKETDRSAKKMTKDFKEVEGGIGGMGKALKGLKAGFAALAASAVVAGTFRLISAAKDAAASIAQIGDVADRIDITVEALQGLRFAATSVGLATQQVDIGLQRFSRRLAEARSGTGEAKAALEELKIEFRDTDGNVKSTTELLFDVADAFKRTTSESERLRLGFKLFDSEGVALAQVLSVGRDRLQELTREGIDLGAILEDSLVRQAQELNIELGKLEAASTAQVKKALLSLSPVLLSLAEKAASLAESIGKLLGPKVDIKFLGKKEINRLIRDADIAILKLQRQTRGFAGRFLSGDEQTLLSMLEQEFEARKELIARRTQLEEAARNEKRLKELESLAATQKTLLTEKEKFLKRVEKIELAQLTKTQRDILTLNKELQNLLALEEVVGAEETLRIRKSLLDSLKKAELENQEEILEERLKKEKEFRDAALSTIKGAIGLSDELLTNFDSIRLMLVEANAMSDNLTGPLAHLVGVLPSRTGANLSFIREQVNLQMEEIRRQLRELTVELGHAPTKAASEAIQKEINRLKERGEFIIRLQARLDKEGLAKYQIELGEATEEGLDKGIQKAFRDVIDTGSFKDFFSTIGESVFDSITDSLIEAFTDKVVRDTFANLFASAGTSGSILNLLGQVAGLFSGFSGGGGGSATLPANANLDFTLAHRGGIVPNLPGSSPFRDSVAMGLTPGERVLSREQTNDLNEFLKEGNEPPQQTVININAIDTQTGVEFLLKNRNILAGITQSDFERNGQLRTLRGR